MFQHSNLTIEQRLQLISSDEEFEVLAGEVFNYQRLNNPVYADYLEHIGEINGSRPFLPIELFKHHDVIATRPFEQIFLSSGTTRSGRSKHPISDLQLYRTLSTAHFENLYGDLKEYNIVALLPSYQENGDSSLIYMVDAFMTSAQNGSGFFGSEFSELMDRLKELKQSKRPTILFGVSFALLDFDPSFSIDFPELTIIETGGMKGRRKELTRSELHAAVKATFPTSQVHSEYGMTELLSQGYAQNGEWFILPPWARCHVISISDPFEILTSGKRGLLAFSDLANVHSCSFIQTRDIGLMNDQGHFKVEGRMDHSDLRGCNLLYT